MVTLIIDGAVEQRLRAERAASGADRFDEVWDGVYVMTPMPNDEHQQLVNRFAAIFQDVIDWPGLGDVRPGINVSDREPNWQDNYRVPDVAVFLKGGRAQRREAYWLGGPDFVVEVLSARDKTREKLDFYARVRVAELLLINRDPWQLELYQLDPSGLGLRGKSTLVGSELLASQVLPFTFRLSPQSHRPVIEVTCTTTGQVWHV